jgi:hypothetical protein
MYQTDTPTNLNIFRRSDVLGLNYLKFLAGAPRTMRSRQHGMLVALGT